MLGEILIDLTITPDSQLDRTCGRCKICISRCPTNAIVQPYVVSAPLCISFQTIEQRGAIPRALRSRMGDWVFGCDHCQDVCPYTKAARDMFDSAFAPTSMENAWPSLGALLSMDQKWFAETYRGTAVKRTKRVGLARNAAVALGNSGHDRDRVALGDALREHDEPLVRSHAAWALAHRYGQDVKLLLESGRHDPDDQVREECTVALESLA
jgi:epoxyqueuosine reductase